MKNISVIGCGTMGNGIAQTFAQYNYNIVLYDIIKDALDKAMLVINKNLGRMVIKDVISKKKNITLKNIITTTDFNMIKKSDLVIEAVSENLDLKNQFLKIRFRMW